MSTEGVRAAPLPVASVASIVGALAHPVAVVDAAWMLVAANERWCRTFPSGPVRPGSTLWHHAPSLAAGDSATVIRATAADGAARTFVLRDDESGTRHDARVASLGDGRFLIELLATHALPEARLEPALQHAISNAELLEQAQAADRAKSRFLATISHELRTPLTALTGYEELLTDEVLGPLTESQADVLERMRSVTHHLTAMIEDVLAFASLETGRERIRPTEFLAADLVRSAAAVVQAQASAKQLALVVDVPDEPLRMYGDVEKIHQVLVNLAGNAVKFTDAGEVRLSVSWDEGRAMARFTVSDSGIGIGAEDQGRLFQPFAQLDAGLTRRHGGTGLGLYLSRRLATMLGGEISVSSAVGKGSVFTVLLPLASPL